ncbi:DUF2804 domain-containing protein [Phenylobacterium sp.]|uniref:DUF2804 domain-containing protein n=1 Tax=Phenylobacterium sp. TaxID=1871053 RepID=UPI0035B224A2
MQHRMGEGPLHDAKGRLAEPGWATAEVKRYSRAGVKAPKWRLKEWDYYCVTTEDFALALTVADNGYMGFLGTAWMDFAARTAVNDAATTGFPMGRMGLPASADAGDVKAAFGGIALEFRHEAGGRRLIVDDPGFGRGRGLKGEIFLSDAPRDRMVIATPFPNAPRAFYYNQKINCLRAEGEVVLGGETRRFSPDSAFAVLDWGRGVWTYDNTWYWGSASGLHDGRRFGFNIGHGFGDTSAASENMVFVDGIAHKLGEVTFHLPQGAHDSGPWRFTSDDGRFEMTFTPIVDRASATDLRIIRSIQHQVFGRFSGEVVLDDGQRLSIRDLVGFAEEVENRW